jgi:Tol biopolymer transport system component
LLSPETGQRIRLTTPPPTTRDNFPCFSPDGKLISFTRDFGPTETDLFIVPAAGGATKQITFDKGRVFGTAWTSDGREIVYAGVRRQGRGMWRVAAAGGAPERVPINGQNPVSPSISRQGNKLVWTEFSSDSDIWLYQGPGFAGRAKPGPFGAPVKLPSSSIHEEHSPDFSPDGQKLVFVSGRTGGQELWVSDAGGNNAARLTTQGGPAGSPRWSPDGKWIAFDSHIGGDGDIYVISSTGGPWRRLTYEKTAETQPAWSRDGQWIYFKSNRTGSYQIHKMPAAGGPAKQITFHGGFEGFESPDGSIFYYTKARGEYGIYAVPAEGGEEKLVPELSRAGYWRSWGVVKEGIYFIAKESAPRQTIRFFSFATRRITPLVEVAGEALWWQPGLALSPDGRRLLFAQLEHAKDEIMLMEDFR